MKKFFVPFVAISFACAGSVYSYGESESRVEVVRGCPFNISVKIENTNRDISTISTSVSQASCYDSEKDAEVRENSVYKYSHSLGSSSTYSFKTLEEFEQICMNIAKFMSSLKNSEDCSLGNECSFSNGKNSTNMQIKVDTSLDHQKVAEILNKYFRSKDKIVDINTSSIEKKAFPNKFGFEKDDSEKSDFEKTIVKRRNKDKRRYRHDNMNVLDDFKKLSDDFSSLFEPFYDEDESVFGLHSRKDKSLRHPPRPPRNFKKIDFDEPFFRKHAEEPRFFDVEPENATRIEKKAAIDRTKIDMAWILNDLGNNENINLHVKFVTGVLKTILGDDVSCVYVPERRTFVISCSGKENAKFMEMKIYRVISELAHNGVDSELFNSIKYDLLPASGLNSIFSVKTYAEDIPGISYDGFNAFLQQFRVAPTVVSVFLPNGRR